MKPCTEVLVVGDRVETHPATNAWIFGDRFGTVVRIGHRWVHVQMDRSCRTKRFSPDNLILAWREHEA